MTDLARPLAEAAERLFSQRCSPDLVNAAETGLWPQALWQDVEDLGPAQLLAAEDRGGAGGDWTDACVLLERAGEHNVPLPLAESVMAGWLLGRAGLPLATGPIALALLDRDIAPALAQGRLSASLPAVPWAAQCGALLIVARDGAGVALVQVPRGAYTATPGRALSGEPRDDVVLSDLPLADPGVVTRRLADLSCLDVSARAALLRAALMAGACRRVLALTLAYSGERVQFGRAIGQFQAVQHQLAQLAEEASAARVAVLAAAAACGGDWAVAAIAAAKVRSGEAAGLCVRIGHHLHGAIGITYEHALHQSTRRLLTWRDEHGAEAYWARQLVAAFRRQGQQGTWAALTAASAR